MIYVGLDMAERHSAMVAITHDGDVALESTLDAGAQETPPNPWKNIRAVRSWFLEHYDFLHDIEPVEVAFVIETPHFHARNGEPALMVQGGLMDAMLSVGETSCPRILAMEWQRFFGYSKKEHGDSKEWARLYAKTYLDYEPGKSESWGGKKTVKKQREDLIDARLLAEWLRQSPVEKFREGLAS